MLNSVTNAYTSATWPISGSAGVTKLRTGAFLNAVTHAVSIK